MSDYNPMCGCNGNTAIAVTIEDGGSSPSTLGKDKREYTSKYSGPLNSGICVCGHSWEEHHLGLVMNRDYIMATGEGYIPQECEYYGCNEIGGMMWDKDGMLVEHCMGYVDRGREHE